MRFCLFGQTTSLYFHFVLSIFEIKRISFCFGSKVLFFFSLSVCVVGMRYFIPEKDTPFFEAVLEREGVSSDAEAILKRS